jgi:hypothetical protein
MTEESNTQEKLLSLKGAVDCSEQQCPKGCGASILSIRIMNRSQNTLYNSTALTLRQKQGRK